MKVQCDGCESAEAVVVCCADEAALCRECDIQVHDANKLAGKHHRVPLFRPPTKTSCDICQDKAGYFFCLEDRALLCHNCDMSIHKLTSTTASHRRFLVTGVTAALHTVSGQAAASPGAAAAAATCPGTPPGKSTVLPRTSKSNNSGAARTVASASASATTSSRSTRRRDRGENAAAAAGVDACRRQSQASPRTSTSNTSSATTPAAARSSAGNYGIPQVPQSRKTSPAAAPAAAAAAAAPPPPPPPGDGSRKTSIFEFLTEAVPGWKCDDLLNLSETPSVTSGYSFDTVSKTDTGFGWLGNPSSIFGNDQIYSRSVPQMDKLPTGVISSRGGAAAADPAAATKTRTKQQDIFFLPEPDDTFVVPDLSLHSAPELPPAVKRRRTYSELDSIFLP